MRCIQPQLRKLSCTYRYRMYVIIRGTIWYCSLVSYIVAIYTRINLGISLRRAYVDSAEMFFAKRKLPINKQLERYAWFWGSWYYYYRVGLDRSWVAPQSPTRYRDHDIELQSVWLLTTFFQAPSIVGKSWKRTWLSEARNTSHIASPSYTVIFHKVCVDLIKSSQLLLNYIRTSLQVGVDHLDRFPW